MADLKPIRLFQVHMPEVVDKALLQTLHSGYITEGPRVKEFEAKFAYAVGSGRALALNSGTSALTLALILAGVGPGDAVVTTAMTCTATNLPILTLGAEPVFADVSPMTGLIDPESVRIILKRRTEGRYKRAGGPRVKAIMCVDWGGRPCDLHALLRLASDFGVPLIEDAAHAMGAWYQGWRVGGIADMTAFSLQAIKHITTVDGGMLTFPTFWAMRDWHHLAYERGKRLRWFGIDRDARTDGDSRIDLDILEPGYKFHMNDVAATIGLAQLPFLEWVVSLQRMNATTYDRELDRDVFYRVPEPPGVKSAHWLYTVLLPSRADRDAFRRFMVETAGIQVSQVHRRNDEYAVFAPFKNPENRGLDHFSERMICLPVHWALTDEDRQRILDACAAWVAGRVVA